MDILKDIASFVFTLLSISGIVIGIVLKAIKQYRKPFEELQDLVDQYHQEFENRLDVLEKQKDFCNGRFANDKESIEQNRRSLNQCSREIDRLFDISADQAEGIHLCMQHDIKGNHIELLENWMRESIKHSIGRDKNNDR